MPAKYVGRPAARRRRAPARRRSPRPAASGGDLGDVTCLDRITKHHPGRRNSIGWRGMRILHNMKLWQLRRLVARPVARPPLPPPVGTLLPRTPSRRAIVGQPRRQFGTLTVAALVPLRLAVGWHFFHEGLEKIAFDTSQDRYAITFSAEGFLSQATWPVGRLVSRFVPSDHYLAEAAGCAVGRTTPQNSPASAPPRLGRSDHRRLGSRVDQGPSHRRPDRRPTCGRRERIRICGGNSGSTTWRARPRHSKTINTNSAAEPNEGRARGGCVAPHARADRHAKAAELHSTPQPWLNRGQRDQQKLPQRLADVLTDKGLESRRRRPPIRRGRDRPVRRTTRLDQQRR